MHENLSHYRLREKATFVKKELDIGPCTPLVFHLIREEFEETGAGLSNDSQLQTMKRDVR